MSLTAMNCRAAEALIQCSLDAPLTAPERARLDGHLEACPACRSARDDYRRLSRDAGEWVRRPARVETPAAVFTAQVLARLGSSRPAAPPFGPRPLAFGLTVALLLALSPVVSPWLPAVPHWQPHWADAAQADGLWAAAQGLFMARWAALLLPPALAVNALFVLRARRAA